MQSRKSQLSEYSNLATGDGEEGQGMVCDCCLQEIDAEAYQNNIARLEQLIKKSYEAQVVEEERVKDSEVSYLFILLSISSCGRQCLNCICFENSTSMLPGGIAIGIHRGYIVTHVIITHGLCKAMEALSPDVAVMPSSASLDTLLR